MMSTCSRQLSSAAIRGPVRLMQGGWSVWMCVYIELVDVCLFAYLLHSVVRIDRKRRRRSVGVAVTVACCPTASSTDRIAPPPPPRSGIPTTEFVVPDSTATVAAATSQRAVSALEVISGSGLILFGGDDATDLIQADLTVAPASPARNSGRSLPLGNAAEIALYRRAVEASVAYSRQR